MLLEFKLSQIVDQKNFISNRIMEIEKDLNKAEEDLKLFEIKTDLLLHHLHYYLRKKDLSRDVTVQTEIYINLKNQLELAKIEEVKRGNAFSNFR